jgi:hypothetical protein
MSEAPLDRRTALVLLGAGALSARLDAATFFSSAEHDLVDAVAEMIIPADEHSPGARGAGVARYIDLVISASPPETQNDWKSEMAAFVAFAEKQSGKPFLQCGAEARARVLDQVAQATDPAARFFARVRELTIFGYYSSEVGLLKELGYKGNQVLSAFPGCKTPMGA